MDQVLKEKLNKLLNQVALLTASCEGNMYHDQTLINKAIFQQAVNIQTELMSILEPI